MPLASAAFFHPSSHPPLSYTFSYSDFPARAVGPVGSTGIAIVYLQSRGWTFSAVSTDASSCAL